MHPEDGVLSPQVIGGAFKELKYHTEPPKAHNLREVLDWLIHYTRNAEKIRSNRLAHAFELAHPERRFTDLDVQMAAVDLRSIIHALLDGVLAVSDREREYLERILVYWKLSIASEKTRGPALQ